MASRTLVHYRMQTTYSPDIALSSLGYSHRLLVKESPLSFPQAFGLALTDFLTSCKECQEVSAIGEGIKQFGRRSQQLTAICENIDNFRARVEERNINEELSNVDLLLQELGHFDILWEALNLSGSPEENIQVISDIFNVHVVLLTHTDTSVQAFIGVCKGKAPLISVEHPITTYSVLVRTNYETSPMISSPESVKQKFNKFSVKNYSFSGGAEAGLRELLTLHHTMLQVLIPVIRKGIQSAGVPDITSEIQRSLKLAEELDVDMEALKQLDSTLPRY